MRFALFKGCNWVPGQVAGSLAVGDSNQESIQQQKLRDALTEISLHAFTPTVPETDVFDARFFATGGLALSTPCRLPFRGVFGTPFLAPHIAHFLPYHQPEPQRAQRCLRLTRREGAASVAVGISFLLLLA